MLNPLAMLALVAAVNGAAAPIADDGEGRMLIRHVSASQMGIVFSYAGDLWRVPLAGGAVEQLTAGPEDDDFPAVSPDGLHIAFSRRVADGWDLYVMPAQGGEPRRLTWDPNADIARGWTPDGSRILFVSHWSDDALSRLYTVGLEEAHPVPLPLPRGWDGSFEPGGNRIAYVPYSLLYELDGSEWRGYRGGRMSRIDLADLEDSSVEPIPASDANDRDPMWMGNTIYFVSDRSGTFNLHAYDPQTREIQQLTEYETYGIDDASAAAGVVTFVQDGRLRVWNVQSGTITDITLQLAPQRSELEPRTVAAGDFIQSASPSAAGDKILFSARGDVLMLDLASGEAENLTETSGAVEREPVMSPDGRWVAYFSDDSGDYQLHVRPVTDEGPIRHIPVELQSSFYRELVWSPDSKRLAFSDK
ncbi:MAG TPA: DPP IV N-terminal domain-containing protein, partial [Gemmatimonadota bacterium]|nr:DPP IV N-terminal domain-containing protein [Gemmatimonadota bacterium]